MAKVTVCDICKKEGKLTKVNHNLGIRNVGKIDVCETHLPEIKKLNAVQFTVLLYGFDGLEITEDEARDILKNKR